MSKTAQTAATDTDTDDHATSKNPPHYLMWFRRDLRIHDNTALAALCERAKEDNASVSAVFFLTPEQWQAHDTSLVQ
ncbi:deoxyribodipyrimidine photo-lyase, partial [Pseudoalteromonas sp. SIMBA_153]